jgi:hypothetical protein
LYEAALDLAATFELAVNREEEPVTSAHKAAQPLAKRH